MNSIRVGVIGAGHLGRYHALNYAQIPEAEHPAPANVITEAMLALPLNK